MRFIDPHAHMISRTTNDYEAMAAAGIVVDAAARLTTPERLAVPTALALVVAAFSVAECASQG